MIFYNLNDHIRVIRMRRSLKKMTIQPWGTQNSSGMTVTLLSNLLQKCCRKYEIIQFLAVRIHNMALAPCPQHLSLIQETNVVPDFHHRIHIVAVYNGGNARFQGDFPNQLIDFNRS